MSGRLRLLTAGLLSLWSVVVLRLLYLQGWQHHDFASLARRQQQYVETIPARPGDILDREGRVLATTVKVYSCFVDPSQLELSDGLVQRLADALQLDATELQSHLSVEQQRRFLCIKHRLSEDEVERIVALDMPRDVGGLQEELRRRYPHGQLAAHVLGWRDIDGVGQSGVEQSLDAELSGVDGQRTLIRDARGYVIDILEQVTLPPVHGRTLRLTIDLDLQAFAEHRLDRLMDEWQAESASAIVLDPQRGEVLAMSCRPTFDPNDPAASPPEHWTNRAVSASFEPGSTLKPIIAAWGLQTGLVHRDDEFDCGRGEYRMGSRLLHDAHPHGTLDLAGVLVKSSNIGMAQVGERLGNARLFAALQAFGFGRRTGIELFGEAVGIVRPLARWDHYSTGSIPMGQELAATPLQIIRAHAALANGGRLITPHLVKADESASRSPANVMVTRILDDETADWIRTGPLVEVAESGTARRAHLEGVTVFAKTGTAQVYDPEAGSYAADRYVSSCVCGAPANVPRALVLVTVHNAQGSGEPFGGLVAAPAASEILRQALEYSKRSGAMAEGTGEYLRQ